MDRDALIRAVLACGADKAAVIAQEQIVLNPMFRDICATNGCGCYGKYWVCPPAAGNIEALMAGIRRYPFALIYQTVSAIEDSFDIEGMREACRRHAQISQKIRARVQPEGSFHMSSEGCHLCPRCAILDGLPCRHPDKALIPLEACGVDVYNTVKDTDLKYINGQNTVTFFGMMMFDEPEGD